MTDDFAHWIGRSVTREDVAAERLLAEYRATMAPHLFDPPSTDHCPPGFHWGLAPATPAADETGPDGAERKGLFLPPVALPRRMWAGGSIETLQPIRAGERVSRRSEIADIRFKRGSGGKMCVLSIRHDIAGAAGLLLRERQDLVFREAASAVLAPPVVGTSAAPPDWIVEASPLLLFRFSAFTFNGHRIHYDAPYAAEEGYPGLLVHGPLQAALMLNLAATRAGHVPRRFDYRCLAPLYGGGSFGVVHDAGRSLFRIVRGDGVTTAEGQAHARGTG